MKLLDTLKARFSKNGTPTPVKKVYTDKSGNKYFTFKEPGNIPHGRWLDAQVYQRWVEFCLTEDKWITMLEEMRKALNQKAPDLTRMGALIEVAMAANEVYCEKETMLNLATVYFTMNDEDPESFLDYWQKAKREAWAKDAGAERFFLQQSVQYTQLSVKQPDLNVQQYLKKIQPVVDEINSQITRSKRSGDG